MRRFLWILLIVVIAIGAAAGGAFLAGGFGGGANAAVGPSGAAVAEGQPEFDPLDPDASTVAVLPADALVGNLSAAGNIALREQKPVLLKAGGEVIDVAVKAGDLVVTGDLLLALATDELQRTVDRAQLDFESARLELEKLGKNTNVDDIASAKAQLLKAQENFENVQAGPSAEELAAARSSVASGWARYNELLEQPSGAAINQAEAALRRAEVDRQEAQRAYDEIKWIPERAMMGPSQQLQRATIDYEAALAAYEEANKPASQSDLQSAISSARQAEETLRKLEEQPTPGTIAEAEAGVAEAKARLAELQSGSYEVDLRTAELNVKQAMMALNDAQEELAAAQVVAPIDGAVLAVGVEEGQQAASGITAVTLADVRDLELTINVAEVDITQIQLGQEAVVEIDALRNQTFAGVVAQISPVSAEGQGVVNYPVTIRLTDENLDGVLAGMTAVATLARDEIAPNSWLVPTNGIAREGERATLQVVRGGAADEDGAQLLSLAVTVGEEQGEWTVVESNELSEGDRVLGSVASYIDEDIAREFSRGG